MKSLFLSLALLLLAASSLAQPSTPAISQVFAFTCNLTITSCPNGLDAALGPVQLSDGHLYATSWWAGQGNANAGGTVVRVSTSGAGMAIHTFQPTGRSFPNGENPVISLNQGTDGNLYGVTEQGGTHNFGVMYKLSRTGVFQLLYNFCSRSGCPDAPAPLTLGSDGNFYGAANHSFFRITPAGVWSLISTIPSDVGTPRLLLANDGNFYGAGSILYRLTPAGQFTVLHTFHYPAFISSNLMQASDGNLYAATGGSGAGTGIIRSSLSGYVEFIHQMTDGEGYSPDLLMQASDGNLWGLSTFRNGSFFTISLSGVSLQSAAFNCNVSGCAPLSMIEAPDGNFYGVAGSGGNAPGQESFGTIFKIAAGLGH